MILLQDSEPEVTAATAEGGLPLTGGE